MKDHLDAIINVYVQRFEDSDGLTAHPIRKANENDAGWDLAAAKDMTIEAHKSVNIPTNFAIAMPDDWCAIIRPRSSTLKRHKLIIMEGVIDSGYRGEMFFEAYNPNDFHVGINSGWRLAQLLFVPVPRVKWHVVNSLPQSTRNNNGFGSSGW